VHFADSHPFRLFPTLVWRAELAEEVLTRVNASALTALAELRRALPPLKVGEGWQSKQNLHERECFAELVASVNAVTAELLDFLKIGHQGIAITGCWLNVLAPGRAHPTHSHPNNFLSGIYYVKTQAGADTVNFHDPRAQTCIIRPPVTALTADNTDQVVVKVKDGTLLLFPAWLDHSVAENRSAEERISVSFNLMFTGYSETMSKPMW
jgi:uncharacterized protein (TIGR02466 family)